MLQTIEAVIDEKGVLRILDPIDLPKMRRVIVTILNEKPPQDMLNRMSQSVEITLLEQKHASGYAKHPSTKAEFSEWESEQSWSDS